MRILLIVLEFPLWLRARQWSYVANLAIAKGMKALGIETVVLPAFHGLGSSDNRSWLAHAKNILAGESFDQVWLWTVHNNYTTEFLEFLTTLAPIRVGWLGENLFYTDLEHELSPELCERKDNFMKQVGALTHVAVAADENEVEYLKRACNIQAIWWPAAVPLANIHPVVEPAPFNHAIFCGFPYGFRKDVLQHPAVNKVLMSISPPENAFSYPDEFNALCASALKMLCNAHAPDMRDITSFVNNLNTIRQDIFTVWQQDLTRYSLIVNLPSYGKCYTSRVIESMAAGRPVMAWRVPDRPRNEALFEEGKEIYLYNSDNLDEFADRVRHILSNQDLMFETAAKAQRKVLRYHTTEVRVRQVLDWIATGTEPIFSDTEAKASQQQVKNVSKQEHDFYVELFTKNKEWSSKEANADEIARWLAIETYLKEIVAQGFASPDVLEIGSGRGWLSGRVAQYGTYTGLEPVRDVVKHARALYPDANFINGTIDTLAPDKIYDIIIATEVIEHILHTEQADFVEKLHEHLHPGGFVIITTPRAELFYSWLKIVEPQPVEHWLDESSLEKLFSIHGFKPLAQQKIYKSMPKVYKLDPNKNDFVTPDRVPLYQGWLFLKKTIVDEKTGFQCNTNPSLPYISPPF